MLPAAAARRGVDGRVSPGRNAITAIFAYFFILLSAVSFMGGVGLILGSILGKVGAPVLCCFAAVFGGFFLLIIKSHVSVLSTAQMDFIPFYFLDVKLPTRIDTLARFLFEFYSFVLFAFLAKLVKEEDTSIWLLLGAFLIALSVLSALIIIGYPHACLAVITADFVLHVGLEMDEFVGYFMGLIFTAVLYGIRCFTEHRNLWNNAKYERYSQEIAALGGPQPPAQGQCNRIIPLQAVLVPPARPEPARPPPASEIHLDEIVVEQPATPFYSPSTTFSPREADRR